jgi:hypothetical protein
MGAGLTRFLHLVEAMPQRKMKRVFSRRGSCQGKGITMEEEIGKPAGGIWDAVNTKSELSLGELKKK